MRPVFPDPEPDSELESLASKSPLASTVTSEHPGRTLITASASTDAPPPGASATTSATVAPSAAAAVEGSECVLYHTLATKDRPGAFRAFERRRYSARRSDAAAESNAVVAAVRDADATTTG